MPLNKLLLLTDGLLPSADGYFLHPALTQWQKQLDSCSQCWFESRPGVPLEWYAELAGTDPGSLLARYLGGERLAGFRQFWIASPFHARLMRDRLQVMPDALFVWREADSVWLCELLNPLLAGEGMKLVCRQECLALLCTEPLEAFPFSFASISGQSLPDRHADGRDGGALMRLMTEVQMLLRQQPAPHRRGGEPDVDGLWFWGGTMIAETSAATHTFAVATRNPLLRAIADGRGARVAISEAEHLPELIKPGEPLPKRVVLAGGDHAVLLKRSVLPKFGKSPWSPKSPKNESTLFSRLRGRIGAA